MAHASSPPNARKSIDRFSHPHPTATSSLPEVIVASVASPTTDQGPSEETPLLHDELYYGDHTRDSLSSGENTLKNNQAEPGHSHSESGSMNMRALLLHVLGDALGNVGVIATGLIIWLTTWSFKYYFDPVISLVITVIIFSSALPLGMISSILYP